jgi:hypothetical protein
MARIIPCDFKADGCDDGRCKIGACLMEINKRAMQGIDPQRSEMAASLAEDRRRGAPPVTEERIDAALSDPEVVNQVRELAALRRKLTEIRLKLAKRKARSGG